MTTTTSITGTDESQAASVVWDGPTRQQLKESAHESIDRFVNAGEDLTKKGLKDYVVASVPAILDAAASGLRKVGIPVGSDSVGESLTKKVGESVDPSIDASVDQTGQVARQALNWSADESIDSTGSFLGGWVSYFTGE